MPASVVVDFVSKNRLFSIFDMATFLTSSSISSWSMSVWQETDTDSFTVFIFFSVGKELNFFSLYWSWISLEAPHLLPFFIPQKVLTMSLVLKCWEHICKFAVDWNSLSARWQKGASFLLKLFLARKFEKVEVWSLFGIVFAHGNGTIPHFHLFCFQNKRLSGVFISLSLVLML